MTHTAKNLCSWFWCGVGTLLALLVVTPGVNALQGPSSSSDVTQVTHGWSNPKAHAGDARLLAVTFQMQPNWHVYADPVQARVFTEFTIIPTIIAPKQADTGLIFETARYPQAVGLKVEASKDPVPVFKDRFTAIVPVRVSSDAKPGELKAVVNVSFQACDDLRCLFPSEVNLSVVLEVLPTDQSTGSSDATIIELHEALLKLPHNAAGQTTQSEAGIVRFDVFGYGFEIDSRGGLGLLLMLSVAALGGALLNFTPCVLPVIPLKIMGLAQAGQSWGKTFALGVSMAVGVVGFWLALGGAIAGSVALVNTGWGQSTGFVGISAANQLFHYPWVTMSLGAIIAIMAVGMCGLFTLQPPQWVYRFRPQQNSHAGSMGFGVMTAVLSTPCTAPFMGAAAAWAAIQAPLITLWVFATIGVGMAVPYLVLSAFPKLVHRMPRTGPASELIKQGMGLLMLAAAAYFIGTGLSGLLAEPPQPPTRLYWWAVLGLVAAAGLWVMIRTWQISRSMVSRGIMTVIGVLVIIGSVWAAERFTDKGPIDWVYYTPEKLAEVRRDNKVVVLEFTAEWCLNCKALEQAVLHQPKVVAAMRPTGEPGVVPMKVDLTGGNVAGTNLLRETGRITIPWLVVQRADGTTVFASEAYTVDQVVKAIAKAREP